MHALVADVRSSTLGGSGTSATPEASAAPVTSPTSTELPEDAHDLVDPVTQRFALRHMQVFTGVGITPTATVTLHDAQRGEDLTDAALAKNGPIEAIYSVIQRITGLDIDLLNFNVSATSEGQDTLGKVAVRIASRTSSPPDAEGSLTSYGAQPKFTGLATNVDIITASANAYISALNRMVSHDSADTRASHKDRSVNI
ncbi:2-isopropylmalate synthase (Alpha-isopropylmalate synthase) (Alpha-IPM synthetase) [Coemansia sp. RSA 1935]|nr:2-isopropylmalate synthase (Alpha-isopropylmalate synthase) (Alpha-IPM synthetase) [Coemansia sp. RSA 1935]